MLYIAAHPEAATGTPLTLERSVFAPSPALLNARLAKRVSSARFEREYTEQLRASYRNNADLWVELVEQAARESVCLVGDREMVIVLFRCLVAVGADRGLVLDPDEDDLVGHATNRWGCARVAAEPPR